jgi:hypothetical protein
MPRDLIRIYGYHDLTEKLRYMHRNYRGPRQALRMTDAYSLLLHPMTRWPDHPILHIRRVPVADFAQP